MLISLVGQPQLFYLWPHHKMKIIFIFLRKFATFFLFLLLAAHLCRMSCHLRIFLSSPPSISDRHFRWISFFFQKHFHLRLAFLRNGWWWCCWHVYAWNSKPSEIIKSFLQTKAKNNRIERNKHTSNASTSNNVIMNNSQLLTIAHGRTFG